MGPYSSEWKTAMDVEMAPWKSTGIYVNEVPPQRPNIVDDMWIFRVKRPPSSPPVFKARYIARGFRQCLHEEIWMRRPPGFTGSFPEGTQWSLPRPVDGLRLAPREWYDTLRTTLAALGFAPLTANPPLFLHTDRSLPPFYILVYVDILVFTTADTEALTLMKAELQKRHTCTDLGEPRSYLGLQITRDRAVHTTTLTQSHMVQQVLQRILARFVAPGKHRLEHYQAAQRVLRYLCSTSGMGLVLRGRCSVVLTGHSDASYADDQEIQRSSQGYTCSIGSGSVSWRSTHSSSVLSSSYEAENHEGAMAA
ncbi:unnamed protein product [Closterium sp. NIES-54]